MSDDSEILYRVEERIARITLNVPNKRNALSFKMRDEFVSALKRAEAGGLKAALEWRDGPFREEGFI